MARIPSSAAIIIKDDTTSWRSKPILAVYISDGHTIHSESVYSMEFLALAGALQLSVFNIDTIHATGCDAKGVLNSIPKRRDRLQHVMRDHHFLLQSIDNSLFREAPMPYHVRGHAEDRKPGKDSRGLLGKDWTKDDWGNWIADRIAAQDLKILRDHGLHIIQFSISAKELYSSLLYTGQWYIGDEKRLPVEPRGVDTLIHQGIWSLYLSERDEFRKQRGEDAKWVPDSSMDHAAKIYDLVKLSFTTASSRVRIIYDKGYLGGNRAKDSKLSDEERSLARRCILCGQDDSQDHWLHFCTHSTLASLRQTILTELNSKITAYRSLSTIHRQLSTAFKSLLMETDEPARIWTANWSHKQITSFCRLVNPQGLEGSENAQFEKDT
jgi:hypothetical protein